MADEANSTEEWRDIPGFAGYQASSHGRIRSLDRMILRRGGLARVKGLILSPFQANGYPRVVLTGRRNVYVHQLVCLAFYGPPPEGHEVAHQDGKRDNCCVTNLRWTTRSDNALDRTRHGTAHTRDTWRFAKVSTPDARRIAKMKAAGRSARDIAQEFSITPAHARVIARQFAE